jgi:Ca2+-binding RTX toxin-like protein
MATIFKSPSGSSIDSVFEVDTYPISLTAGITYEITLSGFTIDNYTDLTLKDPVIKKIAYQSYTSTQGSASIPLFLNVNNDNYPADDTWQTGEQMSFTPTKTGVYNVNVGAAGLFGVAGTYDLLVTGSTPVISTKPTDGNDSITGTSGNDTLDGGLGIDTLTGGMGDDFYIVDNIGDIITEAPAAGNDTVLSKISYTLGNSLENLGLLGSDNIKATGNELNNALSGNDGSNILKGMAGDDALNGGKGSDKLTGGIGADIFTFTSVDDSGITAKTRDTITDFKTSEGDKIDLSGIDTDTFKAGDQAFTKLDVGAKFSGKFAKAGQLFFETSTHILWGNVDAEASADFSIQLNGVSNLVVGNFVL